MDTIIYCLLTFAYLILLAFGCYLAQRHTWADISNVLLLVILALLYDNAVLAIGHYVGEGETLRAMNLPRYWLHALITPLLILFAWRTLVHAHLHWASHRVVSGCFVLLTVGLIIFDLVVEVWGIHLEPVWTNGVVMYKKVGKSGPPLMIIGVMSALLVTSLIVWWKQKWPWYFVGILSMGLAPVIHFWLKSNAVHNIGELLLMISLLATKAYQDTIKQREAMR